MSPAKAVRKASSTQPKSSSGERRSRTVAKSGTPAVREIRVSYRQITPSGLNYRTTFDREPLEELKQEILQHGLTHNLVARSLPDGRYEIVVGGRRTRAIGELVDEGKWNPEALEIPLQVRADLTDADAIILALGENRKRQDVHFLEEAEGIHSALDLMTDGKGASRKNKARTRLAEKMGVSPRWVQILDGLATRLHPEVKDLIRSQGLPLDAAKAFAVVPPEVQLRHLPEILSKAQFHPLSIRATLTRGLPSTEMAVFDPKIYKGETTQVELYANDPTREAPFDDGVVSEHFLDPDQFARLQRQALEQRRTSLESQYAFADLIEGQSLPRHYVEQYGIPDAETGIVLLVDPRDWFVHEVEVRKAPDTPTDPASKNSTSTQEDEDEVSRPQLPPPQATASSLVKKDHLYKVHRAKTTALQKRVAASPSHAMRLVVAALLTSSTPTRLARADLRVAEDWALSPDLEGDLQDFRQLFGELPSEASSLESGSSFCPNHLYIPSWNEEASAQVLGLLADLPDPQVERLFSFLIATRTGSFCDLNPKFGDSPSVLVLARMLGLDRADARLDEGYLSGYSKAHLAAVARICGVEDPSIEKRTLAEIRIALLAAPGFAGFEPPELRFDSTSGIQERLQEITKVSAPSAPERV